MKIDFNDCYFTFNKKDCLFYCDNISISSGEIIGVLGANGAGKSTLFKCLTKELRLFKGDILLDGKSINNFNTKELSKTISLVSQTDYLNIDYEVLLLVLMGITPHLSIFSRPNDEDIKKCNYFINLVGLDEKTNSRYSTLSGGEKKLTSIAQALYKNTEINIFDEPTANLDISNKIKIMKAIKRIVQEQNKIFLISSHDPNEIINIADKIIYFYNKKISIINKEKILDNDLLKLIFNTDVKIISDANKNTSHIILEV